MAQIIGDKLFVFHKSGIDGSSALASRVKEVMAKELGIGQKKEGSGSGVEGVIINNNFTLKYFFLYGL